MTIERQAAFWGREAQGYDDEPDHGLWDPRVRQAWSELLAGVLPHPPRDVADLGCGTGTLSLLLAEQGHRVTGVDFSPEMVARARVKSRGVASVAYAVGDAAEPPIAPGSCDMVLARHVLWALPGPLAAVARWRSLLRDGGRLVLVEGRWSTGAGLAAEATTDLCRRVGLLPTLHRLTDAALWGRRITDERYLVVAR